MRVNTWLAPLASMLVLAACRPVTEPTDEAALAHHGVRDLFPVIVFLTASGAFHSEFQLPPRMFPRSGDLRCSPGASRLAFSRDEKDPRVPGVGEFVTYIVNGDGGGFRALTIPGRMIHLPAWSPDGERLAVWYDDTVGGQITSSGIATVRYDGSDFRSVAVLPRWPVPLSWSPDGREIAFTRAPEQGGMSEIWGLDVQTGSTRRITSPGLAPRWSPDGQWVAFRAHPGEASGWRLTIVRRDGSDRRELINLRDQADFTWTPDGQIIHYNEAGAGLFVVDLFGAVAPFTHSTRTVPHWCGTP